MKRVDTYAGRCSGQAWDMGEYCGEYRPYYFAIWDNERGVDTVCYADTPEGARREAFALWRKQLYTHREETTA